MSAQAVEARTVTPNEAKRAILKAMETKRPVFLWGPPGIGKSDIVSQVTDTFEKSHLIDIRLSLWDPTDIKGMPYYAANDNTMKWAPPTELPDEEMAKKYKTIVLFLDELNSAAPAVQAAAYQLILNRKVGTYKLPDNVVIVAAGNRETDKGVTYRMPAPLANRFVHIEMRVDFEDWLQWATENKIHPDVVGYCSFSKQDLYDFDPKGSSRAFATPRSWSFVSELLDDDLPESTMIDLVAGSVGEGLAVKFAAHRKVASTLPNPTDILAGKVKTMETTDISAMYSLTVSMCYELQEAFKNKAKDWNKQADNFFGFIMDNFETELVVMGVRVAISTYKLPFSPKDLSNFDRFHDKYGKYVSAAMAS